MTGVILVPAIQAPLPAPLEEAYAACCQAERVTPVVPPDAGAASSVAIHLATHYDGPSTRDVPRRLTYRIYVFIDPTRPRQGIVSARTRKEFLRKYYSRQSIVSKLLRFLLP